MTDRAGDQGSVQPDEYYRVLVEQAADGIFIANTEGQYVEVNASGHRLLGYEPGELVGRRIADLVLPDDLPRLAKAMDELVHGASHTQEWGMLRKGGSFIDVEVTAQKLRGGMLLGILRNISLRKDTERKTRASEAHLRSILATAPDTILNVDRSGTILFINRAQPPTRMEDFIGSSCLLHVAPEARWRVEAAIEHVFTTGTLDEYEIQGPVDVEGERTWFSVRAGPVFEGDEVVSVTFCATDISVRKREEEVRRELFERLQKIASQIPGVVYQFKTRPDGTSCFPYASEGIREIYGVSPEEVREDASKAFAILHPEDYSGFVASIRASAASMQPWRHEYRVRAVAGEVRWLQGSSIPEQQKDGAILWHGFVTDITQERTAKTAKEELAEQFRHSQKVESIGRLAGGVAHDFNNLLTSVLGFTELALLELPEESSVRSHLEQVSESAQRGAELTQQLLAFARKKMVHPENVDLSVIVGRMVPMIGRLVGEHFETVLNLAEEPCVVTADIGSLEQIIMNLVVNARDAMPSGGRLTLKTQRVAFDWKGQRHRELDAGAYVVFTVQDTGSGMTDEVKTRLFEPFFTTKPPGQGTGLGLAMCHGMVKQAGGCISVQSALGSGTTVEVFLPRAKSASPPKEAAKPPVIATEGQETLLVVEDDARILRVALDALTRLGYRVLHASDGQQALALVEGFTEPIQLLITDVVMPKMGGLELASRLTKSRHGLRVLFCSGYTGGAIVDHAEVEFLQKPYAPTALARRVREILDRS